jgi:hypothetical protein
MTPEELDQDTASSVARQPYVAPQLERDADWDLVTGIDVSLKL